MLSGGYSASEVEGLAALLEQTEVHLEPWSTVVLYLWHKMGLVNEALDFAHRGVTAYKRAAAKKPGKMQAAVVLLGLQISILLAQARKAVVQSLDRPRQDTALDKTTREEYLNRANELASEANALAGDDINATEAQCELRSGFYLMQSRRLTLKLHEHAYTHSGGPDGSGEVRRRNTLLCARKRSRRADQHCCNSGASSHLRPRKEL